VVYIIKGTEESLFSRTVEGRRFSVQVAGSLR
jgi:hypothetical protein